MAKAERLHLVQAFVPVVLTIESKEELSVLRQALSAHKALKAPHYKGPMTNTEALIAALINV